MTLKNDFKNVHFYLDGTYTFQGIVNGMDYWTHDTRPILAIWYSVHLSQYHMIFGDISGLGQHYAWAFGRNPLEKKGRIIY